MAPRPRKAPKQTDKSSPDAAFRSQLEQLKQASTLQLLFKASRLLDEEALRRSAARQGAPRLRRSHTALLPHIALEGTRVSELAERVGVSKQAISELVDELESAGVVRRSPDPDDARARRVSFTQRGLDGLLQGLALLRELEAELARAIGEQRMRDLHAALAAILAAVEAPRAP